MSEESLYRIPERDGFQTESPIRAFTEWSVHGTYAIGKGFRPSLAHLSSYLHAMEDREHWRLVQVLEATSGVPSFVFRQDKPLSDDTLIERLLGDETFKQGVRDMLAPQPMTAECAAWDTRVTTTLPHSTPGERVIGKVPELGMGYAPADDPVNPRHYGGTNCAEIIENLPGNLAHAVTYIWRAGDKPDQPEIQEIEKALWFLAREKKIAEHRAWSEDEDGDEPALLPDQELHLTWRYGHGKVRGIRESAFYKFAMSRIPEGMTQWKVASIQNVVLYALDRKPTMLRTVMSICQERIDAITRGRGLEP